MSPTGTIRPGLGKSQAATVGADDRGFETSATVLATISALSFSAKSACDTMPMTRPSPSTIGMRLTCRFCINCSQLSRLSPSRHVTGFGLMNFSMGVLCELSPLATTEQHRSRSVMMPMSLRDSWSVTTGMEPTPCLQSMLATFCALSVVRQQTGSGVIASRTFIEKPPSSSVDFRTPINPVEPRAWQTANYADLPRRKDSGLPCGLPEPTIDLWCYC